MNIRATIVERRSARVRTEGAELGHRVPRARQVPLVPFPAPPGIICEVKRRSPSRGGIAEEVDIASHVTRYAEGGACSVSILTEEDYFHGSLADLIDAKKRFPGISFLRKDFLLSQADLDVSYRAGADAVLLIASILDSSLLEELHRSALSLRMTPLVEIHDTADLEKVRPIRPVCVGCNARNLETFRVDLLSPLSLRDRIDWECTTVFESGIWDEEHAAVAASGMFDAILVGESVVRDPTIVPRLIAGFRRPRRRFWPVIAKSIDQSKRAVASGEAPRPLIKICGLTRESDVLLSEELGADAVGFVLCESPRRTTAEFVASLPPSRALRVAVIVVEEGGRLDADVARLLEDGKIDAIQLHGDERPDECYDLAFPYFKALRIRGGEDLQRADRYGSPRVLLDSFSKAARGGTGRQLDAALVEAAAERGPLWLAGGIGPDNVSETVSRYGPELVDASSGLESSPGQKSHASLRAYFAALVRTKR